MANAGAQALPRRRRRHLLPSAAQRRTASRCTPRAWRRAIENLAEWAHHLLATLHRQVAATRDARLRELLDEVSTYPRWPSWHVVAHPCAAPTVVVPLRLRVGDEVSVVVLHQHLDRHARSTSPSTSCTSSCSTPPTTPPPAAPPRRAGRLTTWRRSTTCATSDRAWNAPTRSSCRDRVKFRVGAIVYVAFFARRADDGVRVPQARASALIASEPGKFFLPRPSDLRFNWVVGQLAAIARRRGPRAGGRRVAHGGAAEGVARLRPAPPRTVRTTPEGRGQERSMP